MLAISNIETTSGMSIDKTTVELYGTITSDGLLNNDIRYIKLELLGNLNPMQVKDKLSKIFKDDVNFL